MPDDWRVESYNGVQLRVPPDWGWGGAPMADNFGEGSDLLQCGEGAFAYPAPDGEARFPVNGREELPYVGRAAYYVTDVCSSLQGPRPAPKAPYVWLGAPVPVGQVDLPEGFVQETVEVNGVRVTVGDDDPAELATILYSLEAVDVDANGCTAATTLPEPSNGIAAVAAAESVSVCAYRHGDGRDVVLGYSTSITGPDARHALDTITAMPVVDLDCDPGALPALDTVVLRFHGQSEDADVLARLDGCGGYYTEDGGTRLFTRANVTPWVVDGVGLYASGGQVGNAISGRYDRLGD